MGVESRLHEPDAGLTPERLDDAINRATACLLDKQSTEGYWLGELEGDTILESEFIILKRFLGQDDDAKLREAAAYIRSKQMPNGGWSTFPGGPVDASTSVEAYFALKLTGDASDEPHMQKARRAIQQVGGVPASNSYTKYYLAMLGQIDWSDTPAVPAELMLLPPWFYFNVYELSSWSRGFVVPLCIIHARKPVTRLSDEEGIAELIPPEHRRRLRPAWDSSPFTWRNFFLAVDCLVKLADRIGFLPLRERGVRRAEEWMLEHLEYSDGLGAIFPPIVYSAIAMKTLGYSTQHPRMVRALGELEKLEISEDGLLRLQPCRSPVWDTAIAINALIEAGIKPDHPALVRAAKWTLGREVRIKGDWRIKRPNLEKGGWYFEFENDFYPDIDDTAMVMMALEKLSDVPGKEEACHRALRWLLGMQGKDGGWASFDVDNNKAVMNKIPFADHNAMLDPSTSDIAARILEMLSFFGFDSDSLQARRAIDFLRREQELDGSWYGRWGVNYIYGTWQALRGLGRIGVRADDPAVQDGASWLQNVQHDDGGWGETCVTYDYPYVKGRGPSTASQTAWAVMGLISAGEGASQVVERGVEYLIHSQNAGGTWDEEAFTGGGFPKVFYLKYHLYSHYFPLMALGMYRRLTQT